MTAPPNIDMYLGAPLTEESERSILKTLVAGFEQSGLSAVILANLHIDGRQVDCVVATAHDAWLVEVKSSALLVRGTINGDWERLLPTGQWSAYANAYANQAYSIRDGQAKDSFHSRLALSKALAVTISFRMMAVIATLAGFPIPMRWVYFALMSGLKRAATRAGM